MGAHVRKSAVSPKTVNMAEFLMVLNSFKAMYNCLLNSKNTREGESFISKAFEKQNNISEDLVTFKDEINVPAVAQHLGMLTHLKAWSFVRQNAMQKCMKTLWIDESKIH